MKLFKLYIRNHVEDNLCMYGHFMCWTIKKLKYSNFFCFQLKKQEIKLQEKGNNKLKIASYVVSRGI